jgi:hypothetical protein
MAGTYGRKGGREHRRERSLPGGSGDGRRDLRSGHRSLTATRGFRDLLLVTGNHTVTAWLQWGL